MSKIYKGGEYTFSFEYSDCICQETLSKDFFKKLRSPATLQSLLTEAQYEVYETLLLFKEHVEDDYVYRTLDGLKHLDDYDEKGFSVGFSSSKFFTAVEVESLYLNVVIPIFISCDIASKPTGEFAYLHEYTERVGQDHKLVFNNN